MAIKLLNITFPLVKFEKQNSVYTVADTFIKGAYGNNSWYCDSTKSVFLFTKIPVDTVQQELDHIISDLPKYSVKELNTIPSNLPEDTLSWIKNQLDSIQQLTDPVLKDWKGT